VEQKVRKQRVLFLCTQNSARSQMAEAFLRHHAGDRFEVMSAGCEAAEQIHPYVGEVMEELSIDTSGQRPKGLRTYMGKVGFNYSIIVCARAERNCPKTFPGVGTRLVWAFDDPRGEDVPEEERLEKFREIRDEIEQKIMDWLEHPEAELARLREERERERRERIEAARHAASERGQQMLSEAPSYSGAWKQHSKPGVALLPTS
jgi:arsenate reductase